MIFTQYLSRTLYRVLLFFIFCFEMEKIYDKIGIVVVSRIDLETNKDLVNALHDTCGCDCMVHYVHNNNGTSLTSIYNKFLLDRDNIKYDILVFMHDDIEFLKPGWGAEVLRLFNAHKEYGIIGVAGAAQFDEGGAWWNYKKRYGQVLHRHDGRSWLTAFSPLLDKDLEEVCVIDGLFMAVCRDRISKPFDESFEGFNHYDTSFCLANYVEGYPKIGVTTNIRLAHKSIGETKQNWHDNLKLLNEKYNDYYPIDVEEDNRLDDEGKLT